jgi:predicted DsbA family dithiol-disulfide isomerase
VSYEIHPDTPPEGALLADLFGPGLLQGQEHLRLRCAELGLPFVPPTRLPNSRPAVEAAEFARDAGKHQEFHRAVLSAYFADSLDIGDVDVLERIAAEVGLDGAALRQALASGQFAERRRAAEKEAHSLGITGVPTFFFESGPKVVGAQPLEYFRRVLEGFGEA